MNIRNKLFASVLLLLLSPIAAHAVPITIGSLSSNDDGSTNVITDTLNNLEWLRWDEAANLNYAQTLQSIGTGGAFEGFQIATLSDSTLFLNALFSDVGHACTNDAIAVTQSCANVDFDGFVELTGFNYNINLQYSWFLSDNGGGREVGFIEASTFSTPNVRRSNDWSSLVTSDRYSQAGVDSSTPVNWLMSRQSATVPEPSILALLGLGIAGLGMTRRKKRV